jgi:hypothetical protein
MFRRLCAGLLVSSVAFTIASPGTTTRSLHAAPKKLERIAIADPKEVAKDPDFAIQGEYEGSILGKEEKLGVQVIAKGGGKFDLKVYTGGLPGAGWDGKGVLRGIGERTGDEPRLTPTTLDGKGQLGTLNGGTMGRMIFTYSHDKVNAALSKVERKSKTLGEKPPEGATVLWTFEGDEKNWTNGKVMELSDGKVLTVAKTGGIKTKEKFGAFKAHVEFRLPWMPNSSGQGRGNSGVYLQDRYECQVLDSFGLNGENNECGGIYTQHKPLVNMCLPPLIWQTYDIEFTPAEFTDGKKTKNGRATIYHNGVKIHDNIEFPKECPGGQKEAAAPGPFQFQDHGDPVVYRNVWVVPLK